eukprot:gene5351-6676_t
MSHVPFISDFIIKLSDKTLKRHEGNIGRYYSVEEVAQHNTRNDFWTIVHGKVYDLTDYLMMHPGGPNLIFKHGGKSATDDFEGMFHSRNARAILERFYIGKLLNSSSPSTSTGTSNNNTFLSPSSINMDKIKESRDTYRYIISIPKEKVEDKLDWVSPLSHVSISKVDEYKELGFKSYTPVSQNDDNNTLEFYIKGYEGGSISRHLHNSNIGDELVLRGPIQTSDSFQYESSCATNHLLLIAGGTGITPMIQICKRLFSDSDKIRSKIILIYSNKTKDDIIYHHQLQQLELDHTGRCFFKYVLTQAKEEEKEGESNYLYGHIDSEMIKKCLENVYIQNGIDTITILESLEKRPNIDVLVCGPVQFNKYIKDQVLKIDAIPPDNIHLLE